MPVKFTQNFVMFLAFNYYYGVYRNFVALTYKAVQCFQKYPMIMHKLSVFISSVVEAFSM